MSTIKQRFGQLFKCLKTDILTGKEKLLLTAVILFGLFWCIAGPVRGIEQLIFDSLINEDNSIIIENNQNRLDIEQEKTINQTYLSANSLASLVSKPENSIDTYVDPESASLSVFSSHALLSQKSPITIISQDARGETISYVVQEGDTPSSIAAQYGVTVNTLLWANKLTATSIIRPGDELTILPTDGVLHKVLSGETVSSIAKKYKAEENDVIAFNDLPADGAIQIGQLLVVPDGEMPAPKPTYTSSYTSVSGPGTGKSRAFPYGQCTWYVAQKRYVPWSGHAKSWLANAQAYGFRTGSTPQAGAIMVLTEGGWAGMYYGHVAYVEAVRGEWITISEMNYTCWACKSVRTLHINDKRIRGYIY